MGDPQAVQTLIDALRDHGIPLGRDDVQWAFESAKTGDDMTAWVAEYLNQHTLLSKEELELYEAISGSSASRSNDVPARPILDDELRSALKALDRSTAAIEKQSRILEAQTDSIRTLGDATTIPATKEKRYKDIKSDREIGRLNGDVEEVFESIKEQLERLQKQVKTSTTSLVSTTNERLTSDDQRLDAISKIISKVQQGPGARVDAKAVQKWSEALISFRSSEIKSTIDTEFLEELSRTPANELRGTSDAALRSEKDALKQELETLHAEISSVLSMVVDHESKSPILRGLKQANASEGALQKQWLEYISSTLEYMASRLELVTREAQDLSGLHSSIDKITSALEQILSLPSGLKPQGIGRAAKQGSASAARTVPAEGPHMAILENLNIISSRDETDIPEEMLKSLQSEREAQLQEHEKSSASSTAQILMDVLGKSDKQMAGLLDSLYSNSRFNSVSMSNPVQDGQLDKLEGDVEELGKGIASLDAPAAPEEIAERDAFVSKWSSK